MIAYRGYLNPPIDNFTAPGMTASSASISKEFPSYAALPEPLRKGIGSIFEAFARNLTVNLSSYLRTSISLRHVDTVQIPFARFREREPALTCCATAQVDGAGRKLLTCLPLGLVFQVVEVLMGGKPAPAASIQRHPTEIEKQLIAVLFQRIVHDLDGAFKEIAALRVNFQRLESESTSVQLFGPADSVVIGSFEMKLAEATGQLVVVLPDELGKRIVEILQAPASPAEAPTDPSSQRPILELLMPANVCFEAWLEGISMSVGDLLQLREGQVIVLDHTGDHHVTCTINGEAGFAGQIVSTGKKRAFLIEDHEAAHAGSFAPIPSASGA